VRYTSQSSSVMYCYYSVSDRFHGTLMLRMLVADLTAQLRQFSSCRSTVRRRRRKKDSASENSSRSGDSDWLLLLFFVYFAEAVCNTESNRVC